MKLTLMFKILLVVLLAGSIAAWNMQKENPDAISEQYQVAPAILANVGESVQATGVIRPMVGAEVNVGSQLSGTVTQLLVKVGDSIKKGHLLATLDTAQIKTEIAKRNAELGLLLPSVNLAETNLKRVQQLASKQMISIFEVQSAVSELAVEKAKVRVAEANIESSMVLLSYASIKAPIKGTVASISTREGETVAAGFAAPTFVTIINLKQLEVLAYVDEIDIGKIYPKMSAIFTVDAYPGKSFEAQVSNIQPKAELEGSVVNYVVHLDFELDDNYTLRPEMTVHTELLLSEREGVLQIPRNTVKRENGQQYVLVKSAQGFIKKSITTAWRSEKFVEITSGLNAGDEIAINQR